MLTRATIREEVGQEERVVSVTSFRPSLFQRIAFVLLLIVAAAVGLVLLLPLLLAVLAGVAIFTIFVMLGGLSARMRSAPGDGRENVRVVRRERMD